MKDSKVFHATERAAFEAWYGQKRPEIGLGPPVSFERQSWNDCFAAWAAGAAKARKLEAENKRLRKALEPITMGVFFLSDADVRRAYKALGKEYPFSVKLAQHRA